MREQIEILNLYDNLGKMLNKTINRGEKPIDGENIMLSIAFIKNEEGKYLIQKASLQKGNIYCTTGGHVIHGETGLKAIIREIKEELGIKVNQEELNLIKTFKYPSKNCIFNIYLLNKNIELSTIKLQEEEVSSVKYCSSEEILKLIEKGVFLESHAYIFTHFINS